MSKIVFEQEILKAKELINKGNARVHFIGVGGVGMYSLFSLLFSLGHRVSGSDERRGELFLRLLSRSRRVYSPHSQEVPLGTQIVVYSSAVRNDNPELVYARKNGILALSRAEMLGIIIDRYESSIGVSGTHGKSTVTAMISAVLRKAGVRADTVSGASLSDTNEPFRFENGNTLVYESCEYKDSFLSFFPSIGVFLNLELDHTDYFDGIASLSRSFKKAMANSKIKIVNTDNSYLSEIAEESENVIRTGKSENAKYRLISVSENSGKYSFSVREVSGRVTKIKLNLLGSFQVYNALMAFAALREFGIDGEIIAASLSEFSGIKRRLELLGEYSTHKVYYDYAHHPSEIRAVIEALEKSEGAPIVIFRPHTFSRTRSLLSDFAKSLSLAKRVLLLDIDGVREENIYGVSSEELCEKIGNSATRVTENEIFELIDTTNAPIILMGAANMDKTKELFERIIQK